eukprot:626243-Amphidinium_carterae.1
MPADKSSTETRQEAKSCRSFTHALWESSAGSTVCKWFSKNVASSFSTAHVAPGQRRSSGRDATAVCTISDYLFKVTVTIFWVVQALGHDLHFRKQSFGGQNNGFEHHFLILVPTLLASGFLQASPDTEVWGSGGLYVSSNPSLLTALLT